MKAVLSSNSQNSFDLLIFNDLFLIARLGGEIVTLRGGLTVTSCDQLQQDVINCDKLRLDKDELVMA